MNREFLMLAHTFDIDRHDIGGYYASEKLDGMRCFWDGGISTGTPKTAIPWANTAKDERYRIPPICTGLWSRYGNVIHAPPEWYNHLPKIPLDGELYIGRKQFQRTMSIVKDQCNGWDVWQHVKYRVFDSPSWQSVLAEGVINNVNFRKTIHTKWITELNLEPSQPVPLYLLPGTMRARLHGNPIASWHEQIELPHNRTAAIDTMLTLLKTITDQGGEGLIVRSSTAVWTPRRTKDLLKVKPYHDMEGTVTGYTAGKGKYLGMIGALIVKLSNGKVFELSGFTDLERTVQDDTQWLKQHPGQECPSHIASSTFPIGSTVTFKYRELTDDGIPKEARYWRN